MNLLTDCVSASVHINVELCTSQIESDPYAENLTSVQDAGYWLCFLRHRQCHPKLSTAVFAFQQCACKTSSAIPMFTVGVANCMTIYCIYQPCAGYLNLDASLKQAALLRMFSLLLVKDLDSLYELNVFSFNLMTHENLTHVLHVFIIYLVVKVVKMKNCK